ncbi:galectin-12-like [Hypanus sabinus]|uniref:galectin-12-like n=1 Tax=Hypanus sabinus TaxID=79690 RepID=UPI0028C37DB6|nr:galectin-12-like [Hypanus sabinus]
MALKPIEDWSVKAPFTKRFSQPLKENMMIMVCGTIPTTANQFVINLQQGVEKETAIPFHFGARFDTSPSKVVYSAQKDGNWSPMLDTCCDFGKRGDDFKICFFTWSNCYQACVNGKHILTYDHTTEKIDSVNIYGDVHISSLRVYDLHCT